MAYSAKTKLTLNISKSVLQDAKKESRRRNIPMSRMVETFLSFVSDPSLWCFKCGKEFTVTKSEDCPKCGYLICISCKSCGCKIDKECSIAIYHMRRVYEHLLGGRLK